MNAAARLVSVGVLVALSAACQGAVPSTPSPAPSSSVVTASALPTVPSTTATVAASADATVEPTLAPTATPTQAPTATPTAAPSATSTAEPTPEPSGLVIDWRQRVGAHGLGRPYDDSQSRTYHSGVVFANRFFIAGALEDEDFNQDRGLWSSADGLSWEREDLPNLAEVYETAANAAGLLVMGGSHAGPGLWLTTNGSDWEQVTFTDVPDQWISSIGATPAGFVAVGSGAWTSSNGRDWLAVDASGAHFLAAAGVVRMASYGDRLVALTGGGGSNMPLVAWTSTNLVDWSQVATFSGTRGVHDPTLAGGPLGWVATGFDEATEQRKDFMFWSADGQSWEVVSPPIGPVSDVFVDDAGFIAVGFLHIGTGCALDPAEIQGFTWTSLDGRSWNAMPLDEFLHRRIDHLFRDGRTLIGVGLAYPSPEDGGAASGAVWTARLPALPPAGPGPTAAPSPTPDPGGCGPG